MKIFGFWVILQPFFCLPSFSTFMNYGSIEYDQTCQVQDPLAMNRVASRAKHPSYLQGEILYYARSNQYSCGTCVLITSYSNTFPEYDFNLTRVLTNTFRQSKQPFVVLIADYNRNYTHNIQFLVYDEHASGNSSSIIKGIPIPCPFHDVPLMYLYRPDKNGEFYVYNQRYPIVSMKYYYQGQWTSFMYHASRDQWSIPVTHFHLPLPIRLTNIRNDTLLDLLESPKTPPPLNSMTYSFSSSKSF